MIKQVLAFAVLFFSTSPVYVNAFEKQNSVATQIESMTIKVTGHNFNWIFTYPGVDGVLGTEDDKQSIQHLYLPSNTDVILNITSLDYVYSFAIPELNQEEIAVPELYFSMQFNSGDKKVIKLLGDQLCGYTHNTLIGEIYIVDQSEGFVIGQKN